MHIMMWLHYPLWWSLDSYKVHLCFVVLSVTVCTVGYICIFRGDQIFVDFVSFLSMILYKVLYTWCLSYNICSARFLDIRISTRSHYHWPEQMLIICDIMLQYRLYNLKFLRSSVCLKNYVEIFGPSKMLSENYFLVSDLSLQYH